MGSPGKREGKFRRNWAGRRKGGSGNTEPRRQNARRGSEGKAGNGLLSHDLSIAVPSALQGLTAVFGMGTGVAPAR